jgi:hypothetical protein
MVNAFCFDATIALPIFPPKGLGLEDHFRLALSQSGSRLKYIDPRDPGETGSIKWADVRPGRSFSELNCNRTVLFEDIKNCDLLDVIPFIPTEAEDLSGIDAALISQ